MQIPVINESMVQEQYQSLISEVCLWLNNLEKLLELDMKRKRDSLVRKALQDAQTNFYTSYAISQGYLHPSNLIKSNVLYTYDMLWKHVQEFAQSIVRQCALEYMVVFGSQSIHDKKIDELRIVAFSSSIVDTSPILSSSFSLAETSSSLMYNPVGSNEKPEIFNSLSNSLQKDQGMRTLIFQPMFEVPAASIAILVKYTSDTLMESIEGTLIDGLFNFASLLSSRLAVVFAKATQQQMEKSLRFYRHEIVNLTSSISRAVHDYLGNPDLRYVTNHKLRAVYRDAASSLELFSFLSDNIRLLVNEPIKPFFEYIDVYRDLMYKWENVKRVDARDKRCDIVFMKSSVIVLTDKRYAELIMYNLLTNAVKYAYDGTNIYIHCSQLSTIKRSVLSVTNFSFSISEADAGRIFEYGYRSREAIDYHPEGSGIGLWTIKEIVTLLGGQVSLCPPKLISNYNIPMLHAYVNNYNEYKLLGDLLRHKQICLEYKRLQCQYMINDFGESSDLLSLIVSRHNWSNPTKSQVLDQLEYPTYMIRFEVVF